MFRVGFQSFDLLFQLIDGFRHFVKAADVSHRLEVLTQRLRRAAHQLVCLLDIAQNA